MNVTLTKIKETVRGLPESVNITKAHLDSFLLGSLDSISGTFEGIFDYFKSISFSIGILSTIMFLLMIVPIVELLLLSLRIMRIPANLWLGSARRVSTKIQIFGSNISPLKKKKKKKWDEMM